MDVFFLLDIFINFLSAYEDEHFNIIDDHKTIACTYLQGWFMVDVLAILPFDLIFSSIDNKANSLARLSRIGKLYKLVKITRLLRLIKVVKAKNSLSNAFGSFFKLKEGFEKFIFTLLTFIMTCHILACLWIVTA